MKRKKSKLTLKPLLLLVRVATSEGAGGTADFFFLRGEQAGTVDGCSSFREEEDVAGFLWSL